MMEVDSNRSGGVGPDVAFATARLRVVRADASAIARLQAVFAACGDYFLPLNGRAAPEPDAAEREIRASAESPYRNVALLTDGDHTALGALGWWERKPDDESALLGMLMVVPGHRGAGIAGEVVGGLARRLASRGIRRMHAAIASGDRDRADILTALGFQPLDDRRHVDVARGRIMLSVYERATSGERPDAGSDG